MSDELGHQFEPSGNNPLECTHCTKPERANIHLLSDPAAIPVAKQLIITVSEVGMNISINGAFDAAELALISVIIADMARQNLSAASQLAQSQLRPMDHLKKKGN